MEKFKEGWKQFLDLTQGMKDEKMLSTLYDLLLTPEEKESIAMRCLIIRELLAERRTQREMAKELNVSIAKITRGSNEIKRMKGAFVEYLRGKIKY